MKHRIIASILTLSIVALASPVFALEGSANMERKASSTERKASSTERRVEMQRNLAKRKAEHTAKVLSATVLRLEKIATRLDSRIAKVDASGGTTTDAKIFVAEARVHLALASSTIATFSSLDLSGDKAQENFEKVRVLAKEVKDHLREAHTSLMKATRAIKGPRGEGHATSTSE